MKDHTNWLALLTTIRALSPNRRLAVCADFTERAIRIFDNHAAQDVPDTKAHFDDVRDLLYEMRRDV